MESASRLEGPYTLIVLALEKEIEFGMRWNLSLEGRTD